MRLQLQPQGEELAASERWISDRTTRPRHDLIELFVLVALRASRLVLPRPLSRLVWARELVALFTCAPRRFSNLVIFLPAVNLSGGEGRNHCS